MVRITYLHSGRISEPITEEFADADSCEGYAPGHDFLTIRKGAKVIAYIARGLVRKIEIIEKGEN